jgi:hypothetical protein
MSITCFVNYGKDFLQRQKNRFTHYGMRAIGYVRPHRSCPAKRQLEAMQDADISKVYVEGQGAETLHEAIRALRPGMRLAVMHAALLAEPAKTTKARPRQSLFAALKAAQDKGGVLWELETGRTSDKDCLAIMEDAVDALAKGGRSFRSALNGAKSRGRPKMNWTPWLETMRREWHSLEHATNADAVAAMKANGVPVKNKRQAEYVLGKSGRGS